LELKKKEMELAGDDDDESVIIRMMMGGEANGANSTQQAWNCGDEMMREITVAS